MRRDGNEYFMWYADGKKKQELKVSGQVGKRNTGTTLRFWPPATVTGPIANLKISVDGYLPALSGSNPTNALLRDAPDLYLFGALAESAPYLQHDERLQVWEARLSAGVKALRVSTERRLYGGAPRRREFARTFG